VQSVRRGKLVAAGDSHPQCVSDDTLPFEGEVVRARGLHPARGFRFTESQVAALDLGFSFPAS
jgi:hypothetical protein